MAQFNPSPGQIQDPNYWHWSKAIQTPESDKSAQYALHGAGTVAEGAIKGADEVVKTQLDSDIHEKVDVERQQYSDALLLAENSLNSRGNVQGSDQGSTTTGEVPQDVKRVDSSVSALQGARANGRISETYYYSRLDAIAKDFRSRYPGYRDYIDQKISTITGVTPANAYIKSLIGDINAAQGNNQKEHERVMTELEKFSNSGAPNAPDELAILRATGPSGIDRANRYINSQNARKYAIQQHTEERNDATATASERTEAAAGESSLILNGMYVDNWNKIAAGYGVNSAKDMDDLLKKASTGQINISPQDRANIGMQLNASEVQMRQDAWRRVSQVDPKTGRSLMDDMGGPAKAKEKIDAFLENWKATSDLITNDKLGLATATKRITEEMISQTKSGLLTSKDMGVWLTNLKALDDISPKYAEQYYQQLLANPDFDKNMKNYVAVEMSKVLAQPEFAKTGIPQTFKKMFENLTAKGIEMPKVYDQYIKTMEVITDPKAEPALKKNIALGAFDPSNVGMINQTFKTDTIQNGRMMPGRFSVYNRLGTDDFVSSMKGLKDPTSWNNYVSFMGKSYGDLLQPEIQGLNNIQGSKYVYLTWDDKNYQWGLHLKGDPTARNVLFEQTTTPRLEHIKGMGDAAADQIAQMKSSINRLNSATRPLSRVVSADGGDPNINVLQHMIQMGLDPTISKPAGIPDQLIRSVIQSREAAGPDKKWFDKGSDMPRVAPLQYTDTEAPRGTLKEFLANPGRAAQGKQNNAPAGSPGAPKGNLNIGEILGIKVDDIPEGMSAKQFLQQLKTEGK